jgi:hypothetical protein
MFAAAGAAELFTMILIRIFGASTLLTYRAMLQTKEEPQLRALRKAEDERRAAHDAQQAAAHEAFMESMRASSAAQDAQFTAWFEAECTKDAETAELRAREELERQERSACEDPGR